MCGEKKTRPAMSLRRGNEEKGFYGRFEFWVHSLVSCYQEVQIARLTSKRR